MVLVFLAEFFMGFWLVVGLVLVFLAEFFMGFWMVLGWFWCFWPSFSWVFGWLLDVFGVDEADFEGSFSLHPINCFWL